MSGGTFTAWGPSLTPSTRPGDLCYEVARSDVGRPSGQSLFKEIVGIRPSRPRLLAAAHQAPGRGDDGAWRRDSWRASEAAIRLRV